jgi:DNA-binding NarL/FixJ family response regulator
MRDDVIEAIRHLRMNTGVNGVRLPIVAINVCASAVDRLRVLECGANDCIPEPLSVTEFITRLRIVVHRFPASGGQTIHELVFRHYGLTKAECRLASLLASGKKLDEIAGELQISRNTVRSQLRCIFDKTGARRQAELILLLTSHVSSFAASSGSSGQRILS